MHIDLLSHLLNSTAATVNSALALASYVFCNGVMWTGPFCMSMWSILLCSNGLVQLLGDSFH